MIRGRPLADELPRRREAEDQPAPAAEPPGHGHRRSRTVSLRTLKSVPADPTLQPFLEEAERSRPRTRGDCVDGQRPCPFVTCRHHLLLDVSPASGSIKFNFPGKDIDEIPETCALDVADRGGVTLEAVGELINVTRERIRQMEVRCLIRAKKAAGALEEHKG